MQNQPLLVGELNLCLELVPLEHLQSFNVDQLNRLTVDRPAVEAWGQNHSRFGSLVGRRLTLEASSLWIICETSKWSWMQSRYLKVNSRTVCNFVIFLFIYQEASSEQMPLQMSEAPATGRSPPPVSLHWRPVVLHSQRELQQSGMRRQMWFVARWVEMTTPTVKKWR